MKNIANNLNWQNATTLLLKKGRNGEIETEEVRQELDKLELQFSLINDPGYEAFLRLNRGDL